MSEFTEYTLKIKIPIGASPQLEYRLKSFCQVVNLGAQLFAEKNHAYGDTIRYVGVRGISYEILGAAARLHHLVNIRSDIAEPNNDEWKLMVKDVLMDSMNFGAIGLILLLEGNFLGEY